MLDIDIDLKKKKTKEALGHMFYIITDVKFQVNTGVVKCVQNSVCVHHFPLN